jgi:hypothetical protein
VAAGLTGMEVMVGNRSDAEAASNVGTHDMGECPEEGSQGDRVAVCDNASESAD